MFEDKFARAALKYKWALCPIHTASLRFIYSLETCDTVIYYLGVNQ